MEFRDMIDKIKILPLLELQEKDGDFLGAVMTTDNSCRLEQLLNDFFGQPLKPPQTEASAEISQIAGPYGGIRENQTLYLRKGYQNSSILAMIWPWNNGSNFTLKIFRERLF